MKIDAQTKISAIIKHNEKAIEAIASINPHFRKLRNPVLRKVLAPRVTVKDAARIGGCPVWEILEKLRAIGFEIDMEKVRESEPETPDDRDRIMAAVRAGKVRPLDVRPILESGVDPFQTIMDTLKTLAEDQVLEVINTFEPTPLINILRKKGYGSYTREESGVIYTYFLKVAEAGAQTISPDWLQRVSMEELEREKAGFTHNCREVDVRDLEMPLPMVSILNELEDLPEDDALFVHHKKTPQYLLPELEERGYKAWIAEPAEGNVKMLIHK